MARRNRRTDWRIEAVEARVLLTPVKFAEVVLPGANPNTTPRWNERDFGAAASPVMSDLDGDGLDEILVVAPDRNLIALKHNPANPGGPSVFRQYVVPPQFNAGEINSTPAIATLPHGGKAIFAGTRNGQVWGWNAFTGEVLPNWPQNVGYVAPPGYPNKPAGPIVGHVAVGDLDGDRIPEIVVTSHNQLVTAYNFNGSVRWRYANDDTIFGGVVIADLQGDGSPEIVFGGDSTDDTAFYWRGGRITALTAEGRRAWMKRTDQVIWSSPTAVDLDGNGTLEIVVGTGFFYPQPNPDAGPFPGNMVYALDHQGNDVPGWPFITEFNPFIDARVYTSPAVADLNGDGFLDVIITDSREVMTAISGNPADVFTDTAHGNWRQPRTLWKTQAFPASSTKVYSSPIIVDINGDGQADVVQGSGDGYLRGFNGANGALLFNYTDNPADGFGHQYLNAPAAGKFKPGSSLQLIAAPTTVQIGVTPLWPGSVVLFDLDPSPQAVPPWPLYRSGDDNNAVARPDAYLTPLITRLYDGALGRTPSSAEMTFWRNQFRHAPNLSPGIAGIIGSAEARARLIDGALEPDGFQGWFPKYLGRSAGSSAVDQYSRAIAQGASYAVLQRDIVASPEAFNQINGGDPATWVRYLYQNLLGRAASQGEVDSWVGFLNARGSTLAARQQVAGTFLHSVEITARTVRAWYVDFLGNGSPPQDSLYAAAWDLRRGRTEASVLTAVIASSGNYINASGEGSWLHGLYRDLLQRTGSPAEIASWLSQLEHGASMRGVAAAFLQSPEHLTLYVRAWFQQLLGREPTAAERQSIVGGLGSGVSRAQFLTTIISGNEYFARAGGTNDAFVTAVFRHLMGANPDAAALNFWRARAAEGQNIRVALPQNILAGGYAGGYFKTVINGWFYQYLRRYPNTPVHQGRIFESDAHQNYGAQGFVNYLTAGGNELEVQLAVLTSHEYINLIARRKGYWSGQRWLA